MTWTTWPIVRMLRVHEDSQKAVRKLPSNKILPSVTSSRPAIILSSVVFPAQYCCSFPRKHLQLQHRWVATFASFFISTIVLNPFLADLKKLSNNVSRSIYLSQRAPAVRQGCQPRCPSRSRLGLGRSCPSDDRSWSHFESAHKLLQDSRLFMQVPECLQPPLPIRFNGSCKKPCLELHRILTSK